MKRKTAVRLRDAFDEAEEEFGEDKSTEFLLSITADRENVEYVTVVDALHYCHVHKIPSRSNVPNNVEDEETDNADI